MQTSLTSSAREAGGSTKNNSEGHKNAIALFQERVRKTPSAAALRWKRKGVWVQASWADWEQTSLEVAHGLRALAVGIGDRVALLSDTRVEWYYADIGSLLSGGITVPIYQSNLASECEYILNNAGCKVVFAEDPSQVAKLISCRNTLGSVEKVVYFDDQAALAKPDEQGRRSLTLADVVPAELSSWVLSFDQLRTLGRARLAEEKQREDLRQIWTRLSSQAILTIVYTSGTTGPPKGVVLTHGNLVWECAALGAAMPIDEADGQLLFLPLAHIFARALEWTSIAQGSETTFAESIAHLKANLQEVRPTYLCAVPRVLEKVYLGILGNRNASSPLKRRIFDWAFTVGHQVAGLRQQKALVPLPLRWQYAIATQLVFRKIHALFGGRIRFIVSGGAPLSPQIAGFFHAAGVLILEGWGLTETFAGTCLNRIDDYEIGTVGAPVAGVEIKIAADGEILVRAGSVMKEYYHLPQATVEVLDPDGWFHTGDIGELHNGKLRITDRKKDLIVTSGGKKVPPQNLENALKSTPYISQVMVYGDARPYLVALITLNEENIARWAKEHKLASSTPRQWAIDGAVRKLVQGYVDALNAKEPSYSRLKKFEILPTDFSQDTGELTPTLKVKRKFTTQKYQTIIESLYN